MSEESDLSMLCLILIVGGRLIMMAQHDRFEALFYYFRPEDQVPEIHLLRLIDKHISFEFVRQQPKDSYRQRQRKTSSDWPASKAHRLSPPRKEEKNSVALPQPAQDRSNH